jgi:hypothetical protein
MQTQPRLTGVRDNQDCAILATLHPDEESNLGLLIWRQPRYHYAIGIGSPALLTVRTGDKLLNCFAGNYTASRHLMQFVWPILKTCVFPLHYRDSSTPGQI